MLLSEHLLLHTFGSDLAVRTSSSENLLRSTLHIVAKTMMCHLKTVLKMIKLDSLEPLRLRCSRTRHLFSTNKISLDKSSFCIQVTKELGLTSVWDL